MSALAPTAPKQEDAQEYNWDTTIEDGKISGEEIEVRINNLTHPLKPDITTIHAVHKDKPKKTRVYTVTGEITEAKKEVCEKYRHRHIKGSMVTALSNLYQSVKTPKRLPLSNPKTYENEYTLPISGAVIPLIGAVITFTLMGLFNVLSSIFYPLALFVMGVAILISIFTLILTAFLILTPIFRYMRDDAWYSSQSL